MSDAKYAIELTLQGANSAAAGIGKILSGVGRFPGRLQAANQQLFYFMGNLQSVARLAGRLGTGVMDNLIAPNANYETAVLGFQNLLGSADAAHARIKELYDFAATTSFETPDVLAAGRALENAKIADQIRMIGDMAAYSNQSITEVAFHTAKMFGSIQLGKGLGEGGTRLFEMLILSPDEITRLRTMVDEGAAASDVWSAFQEMMTSKTSGSTERMGDSWEGVTSTLKSLRSEVQRFAGEGLFDAIKDDLIEIRDDLTAAFESGQIQEFAGEVSSIIAELYAGVKDNSIFGLSVEDIINASERERLGELLSTAMSTSATNFGRALYNAVVEYGPTIQRAIIPEKMHGVLGLNKEQAVRDFAAGDIPFRDLDLVSQIEAKAYVASRSGAGDLQARALGYGPVGPTAIASMFGQGDQAKAYLQEWANSQSEVTGMQKLPLVTMRDALAGAGFDTEPKLKPPEPALIAPKERKKTSAADILNLDQSTDEWFSGLFGGNGGAVPASSPVHNFDRIQQEVSGANIGLDETGKKVQALNLALEESVGLQRQLNAEMRQGATF